MFKKTNNNVNCIIKVFSMNHFKNQFQYKKFGFAKSTVESVHSTFVVSSIASTSNLLLDANVYGGREGEINFININ